MKKKIILGCIICLLVFSFIFIAIKFENANNKDFKSIKSKESEFYLYKDDETIYSFNKKNEIIKLGKSKDILEVKYCESLGKYIVIDKEHNLCFLKENGQKELIDKNVTGLQEIGGEDTAIYYMKGKDMYTFLDGKKQVTKIEGNIFEFKSIGKNKVYYEIIAKDGFDIYIKDGLSEGKKILENISRIDFNHDATKAIYFFNKVLYFYDIKLQKSEKVIDIENKILSSQFVNDTDFIYVPYPKNLEKCDLKVDLYYKAYKKDTKKIGTNINWLNYKSTPNGKGVFYLDEEYDLYYRDFSKDSSEKICSDIVISIINTTNDYVYIKDHDKNIYKINKNGKKEKIIKDALENFQYKDKVVLLDNNKNLYIDKNKILNNVEKVIAKGKEITYLTSENKIFSIKDENKPNMLVDMTKGYKEIKYATDFGFLIDFYKNNLNLKDIEGEWVSENNKYMIKFDEENMRFVSKNHNVNLNIKEKRKDYKKLVISVNCEKETNINFIENNKIEVDGIIYKKAEAKVFNDFLNNSTSGKEEAKKILYYEVFCKDVFLANGKFYFIYKTSDENGPAIMLLDEDNKEFDYWEYKTSKTLRAITIYRGND